MTIHTALPAKVKEQLECAIYLYRQAISDLEVAIQSQEWESINCLQGCRDLQAHTIASIINKNSLSLAGAGGQA